MSRYDFSRFASDAEQPRNERGQFWHSQKDGSWKAEPTHGQYHVKRAGRSWHASYKSNHPDSVGWEPVPYATGGYHETDEAGKAAAEKHHADRRE